MGADAMSELPPGFVLDGQGGGIAPPPGFVVDKPQEVDAATDVLKSAAIGPAKAGIGFAGSLGNLATPYNAIMDKVTSMAAPADKVEELNRQRRENQPDLGKYLPGFRSSDELQKNVESVTGPFYKPKTTEGGYAQSVTENTAGALIGPGGLPMKIAQGVGSGLGSEFLANKFKDSIYEPWMRLIGGVVGGAGASGGGATVTALQNRGAASRAGQEIGDILGTGKVNAGAVNRVAGSVAEDALDPSSVMNTQSRLGSEAMGMDLGRQMQGRAEAIATQPGVAQNKVLDAVQNRVGEFGSGTRARVNSTLDTHLGPSRDVVQLRDDIHQIIDQHAAPAYKQVMEKYPVIADETLQNLAQRPAIAEAMSRARNLAANYGEQIEGGQPSLKYWDYVKKGLDQRINTMMRSGMDDLSSAQKADLGGLMSARTALRDHLDKVTGGEYAGARRIAATKPELDEAFKFGQSMFNTKLLPEEIAAHINDLSIPAQAMAQAAARREIERVLDSARNDGAKARAFLDTNNNKAKIENLFGENAAAALENRIGAENTFQTAAHNVADNSRTAVRQELRKDTADPSQANYAPTVLGALKAVPAAGLNYIRQQGMRDTREGVANILTAKGQQLDPVIDQLLNYNNYRKAHAGSPPPQQIEALIRALVAGGVAR